MQSANNSSAILRGEQRSNRFRSRHTIAAAAREVGIPATWIWAWLLAKQLKSQTWLRKIWVRLEDVQGLFADRFALRDAFYATGDSLTSPEAIQQVVDRWPDEEHAYIKFHPSSKVISFPASNPVHSEEKKVV